MAAQSLGVARPPTASKLRLKTGLHYHLLDWPSLAPPAGSSPDPTPVPVLLLHGFLDSCWTWQVLLDTGRLDGFRLLAPDLRGHGDSDRIGAGGYYHFMDYLADLHDLIRQILAASGQAQISLVGHSMGGTIASYYAGAYPEQVRRLVTLDSLSLPPSGGSLDSIPDRVRAWLTAWDRVAAKRQRPMPDLSDAARRLQLYDRRLTEDLSDWLAEHGTYEVAEGGRLFKHDPLHTTPGPYPFMIEVAAAFWRRVTCPTLHVVASDSELAGSEAQLQESLRYFADARLAHVAEAGHMLHRHQPIAVAELLSDFLR